MAKIFTPNIDLDVTYDLGESTGLMFELKEILVTAGWSVVGSGDGTSYEYNGTTGGAGTGSGGVYDLWATSTDVNGTNRWCLVEQPLGGRQFLLVRRTSGTTCNISYSVSGAFTATGAAASTPPTATDQVFTGGATSAASTQTMVDSSNAFLNLWARDDAVSGVYGFGFYCVDRTSGTDIDYNYHVVPVLNTDAADTDPLVIVYNATAAYTFQTIYDPATANVWIPSVDSVDGFSGFGLGQLSTRVGTTIAGDDQAAPIYVSHTTTNVFCKGTIHPDFLLWVGANRSYPNLFKVGTAPNEVYYVYGGGDFLVPWDDAATVPGT